MRAYDLLLFAHILAAIVLVGGSLIGPLLTRRMKHAASVGSLRAHAGVAAAISKVAGPSAVIVLLAGVGMVMMQWSFGTGWIAVSLLLFALSGGLTTALAEPALKRLIAAADDIPDGPVPPEVAVLTHDQKLHGAHTMLLTVDVAIVALMSTKPPLGASISVAVAAVLCGAGITLAERRRALPAPATPSGADG